jgi:hypothetical protein
MIHEHVYPPKIGWFLSPRRTYARNMPSHELMPMSVMKLQTG